MSLVRRCDLCGKDILPLDYDFDMMGSGVPFWGAQYTKERTVKKMFRTHTTVDRAQVIEAHDSCIEKLFKNVK